ncbi:MAG: DUF2752 domain-containing protein [Acidimicrobiia bacterium]|nr:DUF2752 domain-containing protein [Acidimicrobiia bacterium]
MCPPNEHATGTLPPPPPPPPTTAPDGEHHHPPDHVRDHPPRHHGLAPSWVPVAVVGALGIAACVALNLRDPNESGSWGYCPSRALLGIDCPGCGLLRGTHALTTGDLTTALDHNVLILPILGAIAYAYPGVGGERPRHPGAPDRVADLAGRRRVGGARGLLRGAERRRLPRVPGLRRRLRRASTRPTSGRAGATRSHR